MNSKPDGGPAFPQTHDSTSGCVAPAPPVPQGMSLRDYFAGQALAGFCGSISGLVGGYRSSLVIDYESFAADAYAMADALLVARDK